MIVAVLVLARILARIDQILVLLESVLGEKIDMINIILINNIYFWVRKVIYSTLRTGK